MYENQSLIFVNLDKLKNNFLKIKEKCNGAKVGIVLKANAYGLGACTVAEFLQKQGADYFCVANFSEAMELRKKKIKLPILILGYVPNALFEKLIKNNVDLTVYNIEMIRELNEISAKCRKKCKIHIKIDTGMNRLGFLIDDKLKDYLKKNNVDAKLNITLADIFLENTNSELNPNWKNELELHIQKFIEKSRENFDLNEIIILSRIFTEEKYIKGYIDEKIIKNKTYYNFLKNNLEFYNKMGWNESEIQNRNDKLYTIYNIISEYINNQTNGIYLPMETMYSRSKVMTMNDVCTMYLHK